MNDGHGAPAGLAADASEVTASGPTAVYPAPASRSSR